MPIVYRHRRRVTNRSYIGITPKRSSYDLTQMTLEEIEIVSKKMMSLRWGGHLAAAKKSSNTSFCNAIRKYEEENFDHEVLEICDTLATVYEREKHWISVFKSNDRDFGFNMKVGGDGVLLTEEHRKRQKDATKEAMWRPDVRRRHLEVQASLETKEKKKKIG
jgi:hypothetical protein